MSTLIVAIVIALIVGGFISLMLVKSLSPKEKQNRSLETRLQKAENQLREYQQEVSGHFAETSQLINSLTQSYRDVHEHLANGALKLTNPDISRQLIDAGKGDLMLSSPLEVEAETTAQAENEPPRDWAPKDPGAKGQLSEEFGLEPEAGETRPKVVTTAETRPEIKPEAKAEIKPEAKAETKPEAKAETATKTGTQTQPKAKVKAKTETKASSGVEPEGRAKVEAEPKIDKVLAMET